VYKPTQKTSHLPIFLHRKKQLISFYLARVLKLFTTNLKVHKLQIKIFRRTKLAAKIFPAATKRSFDATTKHFCCNKIFLLSHFSLKILLM